MDKLKKFFSKKSVIAVTAAVCAVLIVGVTLMSVYLPYKKGKESKELWTPLMTFDLQNDAVVLQKEADKDFVILNFADIQMDAPSDLNEGKLTYETMKKAVAEVKPSLITLSGDNVWGGQTRQCQKKLISVMESFGIPWAPVYGNHDREGNADLNYLGDRYEKAEHCLFRKGPGNIGGVGNYVIVIKEGDRIVHSLTMLDSNRNRDYSGLKDEDYTYETVDGKRKKVCDTNYDFINIDQIEWYKWAIAGITALNGNVPVTSTAVFHIPLMEYHYAYRLWEQSGFDPAIGTGRMLEDGVYSAPINTGLFAAMKAGGSTKNVIVGHDHINDFSILYEGIRLTYGVKTGDECYWVEDGSMNGGTVVTVKSDGSSSIRQHYIR